MLLPACPDSEAKSNILLVEPLNQVTQSSLPI